MTLHRAVLVSVCMAHLAHTLCDLSQQRLMSCKTFPPLGSNSCILPDSRRRLSCFFCDPEAVFGLSYPLKFVEEWRIFWDLCPTKCWRNKSLTLGSRKPRLAVAIAQNLLVLQDDASSTIKWTSLLNSTIHNLAYRFSNTRCPVDLLVLLAVRTHVCSGGAARTLPAVSITTLYSPSLYELLLNSSSNISGRSESTLLRWSNISNENWLGSVLLETVRSQQTLVRKATNKVQYSKVLAEGSKQQVPLWALLLFILCILLSLTSAYVGHWVSQSHGACVGMLNRSSGARGGNRRWKAGFIGGMMEMQSIAGAPVGRTRSTRAGGMMSFKGTTGTRAGGMMSAMNSKRKY